jgi:hypothetical protein
LYEESFIDSSISVAGICHVGRPCFKPLPLNRNLISMRTTKLNLSIFLMFMLSIHAGGLQGNAQTKQDARESQKKAWVDYEPAVVELKGKLVVKTYFGPPNYGENPRTDSKEKEWVVYLNKPINVRKKTGPDAEYENTSIEDVGELQLVLSIPHKEWIGKKVIVKGTLFRAISGHHHTEVLMHVQSISLAAPD